MDENKGGLIEGKADTLVASEVQKESENKEWTGMVACASCKLKKNYLLTRTRRDNLGWGVHE